MTGDIQFLTTGIGEEIFAVPVASVREVLDLGPMTRIPNAPAFLRGMIDVRGKTVPVVDMRLKLGMPPADPTSHSRIVVLQVEIGGRALEIGALTDRVYEVTALDRHGIEPPPDIGVRWRSDILRGIGRRNDAFVIILDLTTLFASEDPALLTEVS